MSSYSNSVCGNGPVRDVTPIERIQNEQQNQIEILEGVLANLLHGVQPVSRDEETKPIAPSAPKLSSAQCTVARRIENSNERLELMAERIRDAINRLQT